MPNTIRDTGISTGYVKLPVEPGTVTGPLAKSNRSGDKWLALLVLVAIIGAIVMYSTLSIQKPTLRCSSRRKDGNRNVQLLCPETELDLQGDSISALSLSLSGNWSDMNCSIADKEKIYYLDSKESLLSIALPPKESEARSRISEMALRCEPNQIPAYFPLELQVDFTERRPNPGGAYYYTDASTSPFLRNFTYDKDLMVASPTA
jgi:hypothetical protein